MESSHLEHAEVLMALDSPDRMLSFDHIAEKLGIPEHQVAPTMIRSIAWGRILGRIDAESRRLVIDGTQLVKPTPELVKSTTEGLLNMEALLTRELESTKRPHKRNHSAINV